MQTTTTEALRATDADVENCEFSFFCSNLEYIIDKQKACISKR